MNNIDKEDMLGILRSFPNMAEVASELGEDITFPKEFVDDIIICGMGGSGFTGDLLKVYLQHLPIQVHVVKDYTLPEHVHRKSLIFAISYSGNTEETISAYRSAIRRGSKVISISSGGKLQELAKMNNTPHVTVPKGIPPRLSTLYLFIPLINILSFSGFIDDQEKIISKLITDLKSSVDSIEKSAKELAVNVKGKIPIIYTYYKLYCIAEKWKTDINENAKTHAFYNVFPEFNHNEICAYENQMLHSHIIIITDKEETSRIKERIKIFKKLMSQIKIPITEIAITGDNHMTRLISAIWMGLYFSYYLALEYNTDPTPVKIIERLKKELA